jgi:hypothetical protein
VLAQEEARLLYHGFIGTEHLLLGLIHEGEGIAGRALTQIGISLEAVRETVEEVVGVGETRPAGSPPFTPKAKRALELSLREALLLDHTYIGTEHILLGVIREGRGVGAQVLVSLGPGLEGTRDVVLTFLLDQPVAMQRSSSSDRRGRPRAWAVGRGDEEGISHRPRLFVLWSPATRLWSTPLPCRCVHLRALYSPVVGAARRRRRPWGQVNGRQVVGMARRDTDMPDIVEALVLDLLEWIGPGSRPYVEVLEAWRTSCPRLTVWEDANDLGFIASHRDVGRGRFVSVTDKGRDYLREHRPSRAQISRASLDGTLPRQSS